MTVCDVKKTQSGFEQPMFIQALVLQPREGIGWSRPEKYEWDIDPDDADHPTIHVLPGTGIFTL